ncbi:octopamine receptor Oamb isoform X2 [Anastrepha obliqua]|uniref:octopamine receptor Oamb isoform X2 n=1 Tax=Anastrepha obliqua TaxID=95512 RepID=UPI002409BDDA|nr:octopamine receptor Oamb isoform X2 [Anastrepha obliqua]
MNETECDNLVTSLKWTDPANVISLAILLFIILLVISGNSLVIAAVFCSNKLRSVTNYLIVNLAVADLLVGLAVLPFSATWEVFKVWIFGDVWCSIWLAVDVWMCTASILNLCAISLDRYVAVTRPVAYPSIMSTKRAKSLIAGIWVLSFVICFPPLVGWKDHKPTIQPIYRRGNYTLFYSTTSASMEHKLDFGHVQHPQPYQTNQSLFLTGITPAIAMAVTDGFNYPDAAYVSLESGEFIDRTEPAKLFYGKSLCSTKCELTNDRGYVVYSALGSFYIPMLVMLFFYWRIYRAAVRTTRAIKQGFKTTKGSKGIRSRFDEQRLTLRIHRGRGSNQQDSTHSNGSTQSTTTTLGTPSPERLSKYTTRRPFHHDKIKISVSYASSENINELPSGDLAGLRENRPSSSASMLYAVHYNSAKGSDDTETKLYQQQQCNNCYLQVGKSMPEIERRESNISDISHHYGTSTGQQQQQHRNKKIGRRSLKTQVKRFRMETKAAKTLAIIVGLFIFCWLPFFSIYVIRAFCQDCIDPFIFSILFWLGYCNSAVNPMIYALFSKDFRFAFKLIICHCSCSQERISLKSSRRGSDISAGRIRDRRPSITPSVAAHSLGDESEMHLSELSSDHR